MLEKKKKLHLDTIVTPDTIVNPTHHNLGSIILFIFSKLKHV